VEWPVLLGIALLVKSLVDLIYFLLAKRFKAMIPTLVFFAVGILIVLACSLGSGFGIDKFSFYSQILLGLILGGTADFAAELIYRPLHKSIRL
jgi:hypothetical protein